MKTTFNCIFSMLLIVFGSAHSMGQSPTYQIMVKETSVPGLPLQSFIAGESSDGKYILVLGGRTNGFHGTDGTDPAINFPSSLANHFIWVYNLSTGAAKKVNAPANLYSQLSSTNMQGLQDGSILYGCGGYGPNSSGNYVTFPGVFALNIDTVIRHVLNNDTLNIAKLIATTSLDQAAVTGGELVKVGNYFYLVMGQKYTGKYAPPRGQSSTQQYTDEVRQLSFNYSSNGLQASYIRSYTDGNRGDATSRYHRRDLNVVPIIDRNGNVGAAVYGGVFTQNLNGPWQTPVFITKSGDSVNVTLDSAFLQKFNQYGCAQVLSYDSKNKISYTSLLGGISYYVYEPGNNEVHADPAMPFVNTISTLALAGNGSITETWETQYQLPVLVGGETHFIPLPSLLMPNTPGIIDLSKVASSTTGTLIGHMVGGIQATAPQSSNINPTFTNKKMYEVYMIK